MHGWIQFGTTNYHSVHILVALWVVGVTHLHIGVPDKNSFERAKKDRDKVTQKRDHLITNHVLDCLEPYLEAIFLSKSFSVINVSSYHWRIWRF